MDDTDYLVIPSQDYDRIPGTIDGKFFRAATVAQFDEEFGNLKSLPSELRASRSHPNPYAQYYWEDLDQLLEAQR